MISFEDWFDDEFPDLVASEKCGDLVAIKYKKAIERAWVHQQGKIDVVTKQRDSFIAAHCIAMNDVCEHKAMVDNIECILIEIGMVIEDDCLMYETMIERIVDLLG